MPAKVNLEMRQDSKCQAMCCQEFSGGRLWWCICVHDRREKEVASRPKQPRRTALCPPWPLLLPMPPLPTRPSEETPACRHHRELVRATHHEPTIRCKVHFDMESHHAAWPGDEVKPRYRTDAIVPAEFDLLASVLLPIPPR